MSENDNHLKREIADLEAALAERYGRPVETGTWQSNVNSAFITGPDGRLWDKDELLGRGDYAPPT